LIPAAVVERLLALPGEGVTTLIDSGMLTTDHLEALLQAASDLMCSSLDTAGRRLDVVDEAVAAAGADALVPAVAYARAKALVASGEPEHALDMIEAARRGYERAAMVPAALRTDLGRMHVLDDLGRHDEAAAVGAGLLEALATLVATPELERLECAALGNLGVTLGFRGRHTEALAAYRRAEAAWRGLGDSHEAATAVANQGIELLAMGQAGAALACLDVAVAHADDDPAWLGKCLAHRGSALSALGRYVEALRDYDRAGSVLASVGDGTELWRLSVETAATLLSLGLREEATTVVALVEGKLRDAGLNHDLASALAITGRAHLGLGSLDLAKAALGEAALLYRAANDHSGHARALLDLSRASCGQEARTLAEDALALIEVDRWPGVACLAHLRLAELAEHDPSAARAPAYSRLPGARSSAAPPWRRPRCDRTFRSGPHPRRQHPDLAAGR
jgi:tetratricopeptide (TPR) repeat protein